jgi:hypothetical protein
MKCSCGRDAYGSKQKGLDKIGETILYICFWCQKIVGVTIDGEDMS